MAAIGHREMLLEIAQLNLSILPGQSKDTIAFAFDTGFDVANLIK